MNYDAVGVFASAFMLSAFGGMAALLRKDGPVTGRAALASALNSGTLGLGISLLWHEKFRDNLYFLVGLCVIAGLGGMTAVDFVVGSLQKGGLQIKIGKGGDAELPGLSVEEKK